MALLYEILDKARKEGLLATERDLEAPKQEIRNEAEAAELRGVGAGRGA